MIEEPDDWKSVASFEGACSASFGEQCADIEKVRNLGVAVRNEGEPGMQAEKSPGFPTGLKSYGG